MKEIIRGNHDGPGSANATYTNCRVEVPRRILVKEIESGWHPGYHTVRVRRKNSPGKPTKYVRANPDTVFVNNVNRVTGKLRCVAQKDPNAAPDAPYGKRAVAWSREAKMIEFIHGNRDGANQHNDTYTICRLAVPVSRLVEEIEAGIHPAYEVETRGDQKYPEVRSKQSVRDIDAPWHCPVMPPRPEVP